MFVYFYSLLAILALSYASITDIQHRIVKNELSYALIVVGLVAHFIESILSANIQPFTFSLIAVVLVFVFSFILWKLGAWAGGDVKLFTGIAALLPLPPSWSFVPSFYSSLPLFPFLILINAVIIAFPFIMLYIFAKALLDGKLRPNFIEMSKRTVKRAFTLTVYISGFYFFFKLLNMSTLLVIPAMFIGAFLPAWFISVPILLTFTSFLLKPSLFNLASSFLSILVMVGFFEAITFGRKIALVKKVPVSKLKEGMIAATTIYVKNKKAVQVKALSVMNAAKLLAAGTNPFEEPATVIVSARRAAGISDADIKKLKKYAVKSLLIKDSIPMVPILLLGCAASLIIGDLLWILVFVAR